MLSPGKSAWPSDIPLILSVAAGLIQRDFFSSCAVVNRLGLPRALSGQRLVMDGHADSKGAGTDKEQKARPRRDYSIIRGTLLWTHATLGYLPAGTGCLAASSMPYVRHIKGSSDWSRESAICRQSVVPIVHNRIKAVSICLLRVYTCKLLRWDFSL